MRKKRRNAVIILFCLVISSMLGIFALNIHRSPSGETNFSSLQSRNNHNQNHSAANHNGDSLKYNSQSRTYYNIKTKQDTPLIELNAADTLDLQALKGIGVVYARRIWRYKTLLGGFRRIEQLQEVKGMSVELYNFLLSQITLDTTKIQKININTADFETLFQHPYIDYYLAKSIIRYRQNEGYFRELEDLKAIYILEDSTFNKIEPYLTL